MTEAILHCKCGKLLDRVPETDERQYIKKHCPDCNVDVVFEREVKYNIFVEEKLNKPQN